MKEEKNYPERYLGDGVYASFDGFQIWLKTQEGMQIALEPEVYFSLLEYKLQLDAFVTELNENKDKSYWP